GHYDCGSTDITRTIPLGTLTDEERLVYTLVLKGHLQLQNIHFPDGTVGLQLDTAARMPLWRAGYDYGHGTGHGVGHRLCVHEGPVQIRKNCRRDTTLPFHAGQNITNEPGLYIEGKFAVRHENTMLCVPAMENEYGKFLKFEPLTLCPYDLRPIIVGMLTAEERRWLNDYHQLVRETLTPRLKEEVDRQWLAQATRPI
ncbi:MAG: M24 family metallopeptidase C-terminal domain-containing protein, partial [Prevotellaceae bacterium]|nr:M24 family metallopeptidase C-terminal domain-containing protein [Prevotellaceae bacterium]